MNTFQLNCFLAVASTLNFARAAEQMNVSQPAITHQIKSLESELNTRLFQRSTRSVRITAEGLAFLNDAKNIVAISEQAVNRFNNPSEHEIKRFQIGCSSYFQLSLFPPILRELSNRYPYLHPQIHVVPHKQLYPLLEDEQLDVILSIREEHNKKNNMIYKELQSCPIVGLCEAGSYLAEADVVDMEMLSKEPLIFYDPANAVPEVADLQWKLSEGRKVSSLHFCESTEAAMLLTGSGYGVSILPEVFVPPEHDLVKLHLKDTVMLSFGLYYKSFQGNAPLKSFIQLMSQTFKEKSE